MIQRNLCIILSTYFACFFKLLSSALFISAKTLARNEQEIYIWGWCLSRGNENCDLQWEHWELPKLDNLKQLTSLSDALSMLTVSNRVMTISSVELLLAMSWRIVLFKNSKTVSDFDSLETFNQPSWLHKLTRQSKYIHTSPSQKPIKIMFNMCAFNVI